MSQKIYKLVLNSSKLIAPKIMHLEFQKESKEIIDFTPGQFITFKIPGKDANGNDKILNRNYSVANSPGKDHLEVACAYVENGLASEILFNLKPGDSLDAGGPYGIFTLKDDKPKRYVFVGTGTGITPYRAMLPKLAKRMELEDLQVVVVLGVRTEEELLYGKDFQDFAKNNPRFEFKVAYSRQQPGENEDFAIKGHVQDVFPSLNLDNTQDIVYLCGNPDMVDDSFALLESQGFDKKTLRRERYAFVH